MTPLYGDVALQALAGVVVAILIVGALAWAWVDLLVGAGTADDEPVIQGPVAVVIDEAAIEEFVTALPDLVPVPLPTARVLEFTAAPLGQPSVEEPWVVNGPSFDRAGREVRQ